MENTYQKNVITRIENLKDEYSEIKKKGDTISWEKVEYRDLTNLYMKIKIAIEQITGRKSSYFGKVLEIDGYNTYEYKKLNYLVGVLDGLEANIKNGYLVSYSELVRRDLFNNYLEMAEYLLSQGYKDSATVISGSSLEIHLRKIASKHDIELVFLNNREKSRRKTLSNLNSDLSKKKIYNIMEYKKIAS